MADTKPNLPRLSAEQRRAATGQFERAKQVINARNLDYGMELLQNCCAIDPSSLIYRQELRQTQRAKYDNNGVGQSMAYLRSLMGRFRLRRAMMGGRYQDALIDAEALLMRNPWDLTTHLIMARAFEELGWPDHALWTLEQIRPTHPKDPKVNRPLARLYEQRGNFNQAIALWELVRVAEPTDHEAGRKAKDLAASATIAKGRYAEALKREVPSPSQNHAETNADPPALSNTAADAPAERRVPKEVVVVLEKIKNDPRNPNGYLQLAGIYRHADQFERAKTTLEEGLEPTKNHFDLLQELADLEIDAFRRDLAVAEERLRKKPGDVELQQIRTRLTKEINNRELDYYRRRSDRYPTDGGARFEMGLRLMRVGQLEEAIKELQAIRGDPRFHGRALFYLGFCFKSRNNLRLALRNFEEALQHLPDKEAFLRKEALYLLAAGHAEMGDLNRAIELGCELANVDYSYKNISQLIDDWQTKAAK